MSHFGVVVIWSHELTTEGKHQVLKRRLRNTSDLSREHESALREKLPLLFDLPLLLGESQKLWGILEL
jgi:hypothetical protein